MGLIQHTHQLFCCLVLVRMRHELMLCEVLQAPALEAIHQSCTSIRCTPYMLAILCRRIQRLTYADSVSFSWTLSPLPCLIVPSLVITSWLGGSPTIAWYSNDNLLIGKN